jgi:hypothetical protein
MQKQIYIFPELSLKMHAHATEFSDFLNMPYFHILFHPVTFLRSVPVPYRTL